MQRRFPGAHGAGPLLRPLLEHPLYPLPQRRGIGKTPRVLRRFRHVEGHDSIALVV